MGFVSIPMVSMFLLGSVVFLPYTRFNIYFVCLLSFTKLKRNV